MKYLGVDIGATNLKAGLVDEAGDILIQKRMKVAAVTDPAKLAWTILSLLQELCQELRLPITEVASVGVGVPGTVEIHYGTILHTCNLPWRNIPLRKLFHQLSPLPLYIENDANCAALAEYLVGAGRNSKRFMTVTLGTGVGGGIIHNGKISHGANGMAGEVGHMVIVRNGASCPCGRKGCWEQYASATALKRQTRSALDANPNSILAQTVAENGGHVSGQSAFIAARRGCSVARAVCDTYIDYLATGIGNLVNIYQPDTLAIGGGVSNEEETCLLLPLRTRVMQESIPCAEEKRTRIVRAELGTNAGLIGAALLGRKKRV